MVPVNYCFRCEKSRFLEYQRRPANPNGKNMLGTLDMIREEQLSRLRELLSEWKQVPIYRGRLSPRAEIVAGARDLAGFEEVPFLSKWELREGFPGNFLRCGQSLERLLEQGLIELEYTSGTSEEQLQVFFGRGWWEDQEERTFRRNPFVRRALDHRPDARRATLTTPACNGRACLSPWRSRDFRTLGNTLFVNQSRLPFLLREEELARMATEISDWSPLFLDVDPVHGAWFALYCERQGIRFPSLEFVLCSYEFVSVVHRRILERVFDIPVFNLYGSTETGHLLMEGGRGEMKPSYENAVLEVIEADWRGVGELAVTTLTNNYMPLLRYRIGDLVERRAQLEEPTYIVHGRSRDSLRDRDGRRVTTWEVDQCFAEVRGVAHYQLHQERSKACRLRFVPDGSGPPAEEQRRLVSRLETLLQSPGEIEMEAMNFVLPTLSGKFRLTSSAAVAPGMN
jgi:phenylacetate-CoA ligase